MSPAREVPPPPTLLSMSDAEETLTDRLPAAAPAHDGRPAEQEATVEDGETAGADEAEEAEKRAGEDGGTTAGSGEGAAAGEPAGRGGTPGAEESPDTGRHGPWPRLPGPTAPAAPTAVTRGGAAWRSTWTRTS